ncbi:MAG: prepilin-type N-terminal cleavage/methylation domain-containing protein [Phycisphaerales bacterium]
MNFEKSKRRLGFTLVELLVVISIIALLLAILMPALSKARNQGRSIVCRKNLSQLVMGTLLYAENNNRTMPIGFLAGATDPHAWYTLIAPYVRNGKDYSSGTFTVTEIMHCPSDKGPPKNNVNAYRGAGKRSYSMNGYVSNLKLVNIKRSSECFLQGDHDWWVANANVLLFKRTYLNAFPKDRHGRFINLSFADGHVSPVEKSAIDVGGANIYFWSPDGKVPELEK